MEEKQQQLLLELVTFAGKMAAVYAPGVGRLSALAIENIQMLIKAKRNREALAEIRKHFTLDDLAAEKEAIAQASATMADEHAEMVDLIEDIAVRALSAAIGIVAVL